MHVNIFLFDLDGVLVQPGGYRAAVRATVNYFTGLMGLGDLAPEDETIAIYESQGITCEWDMVPITLAIILNRAAEQAGAHLPLDNLQTATNWLKSNPIEAISIDFDPILQGLGRYVRVGEAPADTLLNLCMDDQGRELFPHLVGHGILQDLLAHTRRPSQSRTTRVFETFVMGDAAYSQTMQLPAEVQCDSFLAAYDRPLLHAQTRRRVLARKEQQALWVAAYTARPSTPLLEVYEPLAVYVPEAEMALELVGMESIALVGSGQMGEAAQRLGEMEDRLTKPAPFHALAAIAAAWTEDRQASMEWVMEAFRHFERGEGQVSRQIAGILLPDHLDLHIFEDSPSGMMGGKAAGEMLSALGVNVNLHLWGVSTHPDKIRALEALGALVSPDINRAVELALP